MNLVVERFLLIFTEIILAYILFIAIWNVIGCLWFECCLLSFYIAKTSCGTHSLLIASYFSKRRCPKLKKYLD